MFNPRKGQWWNADDKFQAYYMTLRVHYEMPALEAYRMARKNFADYPEFFDNPMGTLRDRRTASPRKIRKVRG